jgi:hypothetical protein
VFQPGGYHLMLMHAKHDIKPGSEVTITLRFADGQTVSARYRVRKPTAQ